MRTWVKNPVPTLTPWKGWSSRLELESWVASGGAGLLPSDPQGQLCKMGM